MAFSLQLPEPIETIRPMCLASLWRCTAQLPMGCIPYLYALPPLLDLVRAALVGMHISSTSYHQLVQPGMWVAPLKPTCEVLRLFHARSYRGVRSGLIPAVAKVKASCCTGGLSDHTRYTKPYVYLGRTCTGLFKPDVDVSWTTYTSPSRNSSLKPPAR
jgi:hypothetical protein